MVTFVETQLFSRLVGKYLTDDEYSELQLALVANPFAGRVIPRSGGVRKLRWGTRNQGKRGGIRVIYFVRRADEIWMLTLYAKNEATSIAAAVLKQMKDELDG